MCTALVLCSWTHWSLHSNIPTFWSAPTCPSTTLVHSPTVLHAPMSSFSPLLSLPLFNASSLLIWYLTMFLVPLHILSCPTSRAVLSAVESMSVYDSLDADVLHSYHEYSLASLLYYAMKESSCSELSARMTAMDGASKNAGVLLLVSLWYSPLCSIRCFSHSPSYCCVIVLTTMVMSWCPSIHCHVTLLLLTFMSPPRHSLSRDCPFSHQSLPCHHCRPHVLCCARR